MKEEIGKMKAGHVQRGPEAKIALCKCKESKKMYGVRFEKSGNGWKYTWAFPIKEATAKRENYDDTSMVGDIFPEDEYPGCPYCGRKCFVGCSCGRLSCNINNNTFFTCDWCGASGTLSNYDGAGVSSGGDLG